MNYYLGVDAGGTTTVSVVCDEKGNILGKVKGKSVNYNSVGMAQARENLKAVSEEIIKKTGVSRVSRSFVGLSALNGRADDGLCKEFFSDTVFYGNVIMDSDLYICLESMLTDGPCAAAISGTGSMTAGRVSRDRIIHKGGWGYILGDEGSGYAMCIDALRAAVRSFEGCAKRTALIGEICDCFEVNSMYELIDRFYDPPMSRSEIAAFMPRLIKCVRMGDEVAAAIVKSQAAAFGATACSLLQEMPRNTSLGLWGGVMRTYREFSDEFIGYVRKRFPSVETGLLKYPPEIGAVFAAMNSDGVRITEDILNNLAKLKG